MLDEYGGPLEQDGEATPGQQALEVLAHAAKRMRVGGTARLTCPAALFGAGGAGVSGEEVGGGAVRVELELLRFGEIEPLSDGRGSVLVSYQRGWGEDAVPFPGGGRQLGVGARAAFSGTTGNEVRLNLIWKHL